MSTPHIAASFGEIAERIILTSDSSTSERIAEEYMSDSVLFSDIRGMKGYTGNFNGIRLSVLGIGVGVPSASIYVHELLEQYSVKSIIHIGSCLPIQPEIKEGDIILASGCSTDNAFLKHTFLGDFAPLPNYEMLEKAYISFSKEKITPHVGLLVTTDTIYEDLSSDKKIWENFGILGIDTEGAAIYTLASKFRAKALVMAAVFNEFSLTNRPPSDLIKISLDTLIEF